LKPFLPFMLLAAAPACLGQTSTPTPASSAAAVTVTLTMRDPSALELSYQIPPSCTALEFGNPAIRPDIAPALRSDWRALDDCTEVDAQGVRPRHAGCTTLRVQVPATTRSHDARVYDRVYPWALPLGNGLLTHTSAFAVAPACGPVNWRFAVRGGTVVVDGVVSAQQASRDADAPEAHYLPVVLLAEPYRPGAPPVHVDATVSPANRALLDDTIQQATKEYGRMLPGLPIPQPYLVASTSDTRRWRSYVAHRSVMHLTLSSAPDPGARQDLPLHIAHEAAHLVQASRAGDAWKDEAATIDEGGAEFLSLVTATRLGWITPAGFRDRLEVATNACVLALDGKPWKRFEQHAWGRQPYACGLMMYALGLRENPTGAGPLARLRDYERQARAGIPTDFAQALECGNLAGCTPRWLARIAGDEALEAVLRDYARQPGALLRPATQRNPALTNLLAHRHFRHLMAADCRGAVSIYPEPTAARIGPVSGCATLREGMRVVGAEGAPLFVGGKGLQASIEACRERGKTILDLESGGSVTLACNASFVLPEGLLAIDTDKALSLTK
jgi:hypothetical protein